MVLVVQGVGVWSMSETSTRKPGALASLRPQLGLPAGARRPLAAAVPALVAVWALAGFYGSLGPTLIRGVAGSSSIVLGGLALAVLAGGGAVTVLLVRDLEARVVTVLGTSALLVGVGVTLLAIASSSEAGFFVGTAIAGVGFGAAFQGALRTVLPLAEPHERAGVLSTIYVVCYLAMGLPAVLAGIAVVDGGGVLLTARGYGLVVMALAAAALIGALLRRTPAPVALPVAVETFETADDGVLCEAC